MFKKLFAGLKKTRETLVTGMRKLLGKGLLEHRDFVYREFLELPVEL